MKQPEMTDIARRLFGAVPKARLALLRAAWPAAVGPELARRTEVLVLEGDTLRVRVPDATWRRGLIRMRGDILARLRSTAGELAPRRLAFAEGPLSRPPAPPPPPPEPEAPPPPSLALAAASVPDPELRRAFLATAARYLNRFNRA